MKYRAEINGLRALAVVPVILFHAGFTLFSGGYVGVDVFFVISGYLITTILIDDIENNRFSIVNFYERRARRILPALFFVIICCLPFAYLWMVPNQMKDFSQSIVAVSVFASNILFWSESGYFDAATEEKPLLHTWSLAVEEQYYVIFPVFLILAWRYGRNRVFWMIVVLAVMSLFLSEHQSKNNITANFYLAPTRAWELFAGSIAAFILQKRGVTDNNPLSIIGFLAIVASILWYDSSTPFPSLYALLPVGGVLLIVMYAGSGTLVGKLLSTKLLVGIGLVSYSAYLWHQPIFAFVRISSFGEPSHWLMLALSVISVLLAIFSWKYIEQPFRNSGSFNRKQIFTFSIIGMTAFAGLGMFGHLKNGNLTSHSLAPNVEWANLGQKLEKAGPVCQSERINGTQWLEGCEFGSTDADKTVILYGDSHGVALSYSLDTYFKKSNIKGLTLDIEGCELVPYIRTNQDKTVTNCGERFDELLAYIRSTEADVIATSRWTFRLYPIEGYNLDMPYRNSEGYIERADFREFDILIDGKFYRDADTKREYFTKFLTKLADVSKNFILLYPIPETAINIEKGNQLHYRNTNELLDQLSTPYKDYMERNQFVSEIFDSLPQTNITRVKVDELFCNNYIENRCILQWDKTPLYYDSDHLSYEGANIVVEEIVNLSDW